MNEREDKLFEDWWESEGQYHRAGGGKYEKTFAYHAWMAVINRQGHKLVPVEPTEEMIDAGVDESDVDWKRLKFAYQAMIGAIE